MKKFILDCSGIAGMYNDSRINISYHNGDLEVQIISIKTPQIGTVKYTYLSSIYIGKIRPSCKGYITFGDKGQKEFEFNEKNKEIVWTGPDAEDKWIGGYFC